MYSVEYLCSGLLSGLPECQCQPVEGCLDGLILSDTLPTALYSTAVYSTLLHCSALQGSAVSDSVRYDTDTEAAPVRTGPGGARPGSGTSLLVRYSYLTSSAFLPGEVSSQGSPLCNLPGPLSLGMTTAQ